MTYLQIRNLVVLLHSLLPWVDPRLSPDLVFCLHPRRVTHRPSPVCSHLALVLGNVIWANPTDARSARVT